MQRHERPSGSILCLVEGYPPLFGGDGGVKADAAHLKWVRSFLLEHPGRWCLVGEVRYSARQRVNVGTSGEGLRKQGFEVEQINGNVYARSAHPNGRPLSDFVERQKPWTPGDALPELVDNKFGWSKSEINDALAMARAWLFPIEGIAAA